MDTENIMLEHYKGVAAAYGNLSSSTMKDPYIRQSECEFFIKEIQEYKKRSGKKIITVVDLGCGNGILLAELAREYPQDIKIGIELTPELAAIARERNLASTEIYCGNGTELCSYVESADIIMTERMLINVLNENHRLEIFQNIKKCLLPGGLYLMSESFTSGLYKLNAARSEMKLKKLTQSYQNRYLKEVEIETLISLGFEEILGQTPRHFLSTHFYVTRVFHNLVRPPRGKLEGTEFVKFFDEGFGPNIGKYSPIQFRVFKGCPGS